MLHDTDFVSHSFSIGIFGFFATLGERYDAMLGYYYGGSLLILKINWQHWPWYCFFIDGYVGSLINYCSTSCAVLLSKRIHSSTFISVETFLGITTWIKLAVNSVFQSWLHSCTHSGIVFFRKQWCFFNKFLSRSEETFSCQIMTSWWYCTTKRGYTNWHVVFALHVRSSCSSLCQSKFLTSITYSMLLLTVSKIADYIFIY